jgi:hypothetical protein
VALMVVFLGMGETVLTLTLGEAKAPSSAWTDRFATSAPILILLLLVLALGVYMPSGLERALWDAARWIEAVP